MAYRRRYLRLVPLMTIGLILLALVPYRLSTHGVLALDGSLARTPPMGWNSWNHFGCDVSEELVRATADALSGSGMRDAGYQYLVIDDCWQVGRDDNGTIVADPERFPSGMWALGEYVHSRGLRFGIYTDVGPKTCQGRPGSLGYEQQDADTYATWGVDYVKVDWCYNKGLDAPSSYGKMRDALARTGRPIVLSICTWGDREPWSWGPGTGHLWRTTNDITDDWKSIVGIIDSTARHAPIAGPGGWNDPDMLEVGNGGMTYDEYRAHFSMWALMAAPLMAGNDVTQMSPETREILLNSEVIAVDQDQAGIQGNIVDDTGTDLQVWAKPLHDGGRAVVLFNRTDRSAGITATWEKIGLPPGEATVRDLWQHADQGSYRDSYSATVPPHGVVMLKIASKAPADAPPADAPPASVVSFLSDQPWSAASSGWGPVERDQSNGENGAGDGRPLTLNGVVYGKGLGVHAPSKIAYQLNGACWAFSARVGIDDEAGTYGAAARSRSSCTQNLTA